MPVSALLKLLLIVSLRGVFGASGGSGAAATDTLSAGRSLAGGDGRLVSNNTKFTLGFFQAHGSSDWCLGIWFTAVPDLTTVWVANYGNPVMDGASSPELAISTDGDLAVFNLVDGTTAWSTNSTNGTIKTSTTTNTSAVLLNSGNLVLLDTADQLRWQSFDHHTNTLLPSAKLGRDKLTGVNRRLVSSMTPAGQPSPGAYCFEVDEAAPRLVLRHCDSATTYWTSGLWNGKYFMDIPEMSGSFASFTNKFVYDDREQYLQYNVTDQAVVARNVLNAGGQSRIQFWLGADWTTFYTKPEIQCQVYGLCGPDAVCGGLSMLALCSCIKGFSVRSPEDWEQGDRTGGCVRDTQLNCTPRNTSAADSGDKFYAMTDISLPAKSQSVQQARSLDECGNACVNNCSCSAYSYGGQGCLVWMGALLNTKSQQGSGGTATVSDGETLYIRLAASEVGARSSRSKSAIVGVAIAGATAAVLVLAALMMRRSNTKNVVQGVDGLVAFRYRELRSATRNFSEKLGQGSFGSVFKGQLIINTSATEIAVKRLDGSSQGEKQFRAEVSSIGVVRHINLVKLIGFCCDGDGRFLVYEHMPNRSLDIHLFNRSNNYGDGQVFLDWSARYRIAVGVARGLAYLHEGCINQIIHCDVKPQNILLDASLRPKIADFGMAKFLQRDFSRVLTTMRGTMGYLAPEWISGTPITAKVDVYSYGMVLLELVSGTRNTGRGSWTDTFTDSDGGGHVEYFPVRASRKLLEGDVASLLDIRLFGEANLMEVERACKVACWCIQDDEAARPAMGQVVQILEGVLDRKMPPLPRLLETIFVRPPEYVNTSTFLSQQTVLTTKSCK